MLDLIKKTVDLYLSGHTEDEISKRFEVPISTVRNILSKQGCYTSC